MDAEVSLLMANQALAKSGSAIWDPFAGTGSMLVTAAHWGARVWGSDIDGRQMKGRDAIKGGTGAFSLLTSLRDASKANLTFLLFAAFFSTQVLLGFISRQLNMECWTVSWIC